MPNSALYLSTIFLWGASWYVIKLQLGEVAPQVSVFYRFVISALILLLYCLLRGRSLRYRPADHMRFAFIGLFLFNLNYIAVYFASFYLTTGLVSVIFSSAKGDTSGFLRAKASATTTFPISLFRLVKYIRWFGFP